MEIIANHNRVSSDFYKFYTLSRKLRNRLAHRYKMPSDAELLSNLKDNLHFVEKLEIALKRLEPLSFHINDKGSSLIMHQNQ